MNSFDTDLQRLKAQSIVVLEAGQTSPDQEAIFCLEGKHIKFDVGALGSYCLTDWNSTLYDALLLAGAVEYCDRVQRRPALGWGREINLKIPVHDIKHWNSPEVGNSLHAVLELLTGDRWNVSFVARNTAVPYNKQSKLHLEETGVSVMPFSDGLDSWAVAELEEHRLGSKLVKVRLGRKGSDAPKRVRRGREKRKVFTAIPYKVKVEMRMTRESSNRSRGFKFAMLSGIGGYLSKAKNIIVSESGQGALGPWFANLGHAYPDLRSHPLFLRKMEAFLSALLQYDVRYSFPRIWMTKAQTVFEAVQISDNPDHWMKTWSCWQQNRQVSVSGKKRQCGICAACMLRRLSVHAAGLSESQDRYIWGNLSGSDFALSADPNYPEEKRNSVTQKAYAIAGALHMDHMASLEMATSDAYQTKVLQLAGTLGITPSEASLKSNALWAKHAKEWQSFTNALGVNSFVFDWIERRV